LIKPLPSSCLSNKSKSFFHNGAKASMAQHLRKI
jgi:hypothetical protein